MTCVCIANVLSRLVWCCTRCRCKEGGGYERAGLRGVQGRDDCCHRYALAPGAPPFNCLTFSTIYSIVHLLALSFIYPSHPPPPSLSLSLSHTLSLSYTHTHTQGFKFLGKAIKVTYARGTSDIVARANGIIPLSIFNPLCAAVMRLTPWACTYIPKDKRKKLEAAASAKRGAHIPAAFQRSLFLTTLFAGRDEGEDGAAPSKKCTAQHPK